MTVICIFLGVPGSGKGTQANRISKQFGMAQLSTGDLFREALKNDPNGKLAKIVSAGDLVPDEMVLELVKRTLKSKGDYSKGIIFDGFPRTIKQADALKEIVREMGAKIQVILLELGLEKAIRRISGRRICSQCAMVYHLPNHLHKEEGICDHIMGTYRTNYS